MGAKLMGRKNIFDSTAPEPMPEPQKPAALPEVFQYGPVGAMRNNLREIGARSIQDLDPDLIEDTGHRDRLAITDEDVADLRASIAAYGQQVPILVRPHPRLSGRYQVVYGRRRLAAITGMGVTVKAMVRSMSDREAVLAQGQENSVRKDPSFIEKALFAQALRASGYEAPLILDALNLNRAILSQMDTVTASIPAEMIYAIGAADGIGRRRWMDLVNIVKAIDGDAARLIPGDLEANLATDMRFDQVDRALKAYLRPAPAHADRVEKHVVKSTDGRSIAEVLADPMRLRLIIDKKHNADFAGWLMANADAVITRLHDEFTAQHHSAHPTINPKS